MKTGTMIDHLSRVSALFLCALQESAVNAVCIEDAHAHGSEIERRAQSQLAPSLSILWQHFDPGAQRLAVRLSHALRAHPVGAASHSRRCPSCRKPVLVEERSGQIGLAIADFLQAVRVRQFDALKCLTSTIPSDLDEGHTLSFATMLRAFRRRAAEHGLPRRICRHVEDALQRCIEASTQVCFEFAFAA